MARVPNRCADASAGAGRAGHAVRWSGRPDVKALRHRAKSARNGRRASAPPFGAVEQTELTRLQPLAAGGVWSRSAPRRRHPAGCGGCPRPSARDSGRSDAAGGTPAGRARGTSARRAARRRHGARSRCPAGTTVRGCASGSRGGRCGGSSRTGLPPSSSAQEQVPDARVREDPREPLLAEVRHEARVRPGAHVGDGFDAVAPQQRKKVLDRMVGVPDREQRVARRLCHCACAASAGSLTGSSRTMPITKNTRMVATPRRWLPVQ